MSMLFGVRYKIDPPAMDRQPQDVLRANGWTARDDGAAIAVFPSAKHMATEFDRLVRNSAPVQTARFVFQDEDGRFIPVLPVFPDVEVG